jgi:trimethylamine--corrinoid protein Co-methyltransferase
MLVAIKRQLPFIFSSYGMLGASTPITLIDTLSLLHAELLAGLTLTQLLKEGSPIILGPMPAIFDMKTMVSYYDPLSMVLNLAFAEMMAYYRIPHCGTSGSTTGWDPDIVSASEMMMNQLSSLMGKVGLAPFIGSLHDGKVLSPLNMVHADEIISQALRFSKGFHLEINDTALHEILQVGPGGSFLSTDRTLDLFRTVTRESEIFPRWGLEKWQEVGKPQYIEILRARTLDLINTLEPPTDYEDLIRRGEELIDRYTSNPIS